jgi:hypothetical protein
VPKFHVAGRLEGILDESGEERDDRLESGWAGTKEDAFRFMRARNGDNLMTQFECDYCVFFKLASKPPLAESPSDVLIMAAIRRVTLDAFWSRATSTVEDHARKIWRIVTFSLSHGFSTVGLENPGPLPPHDHCGYQVAIMTVLDSLDSGRHSAMHKQWDTVRRLRTAFSNQSRLAATANSSHLAISDQAGKEYRRISQDPCSALWFARFSEGCKKRMGQDWRPDQAVMSELMVELLRAVESRMRGSKSESEVIQWTLAGGYFALCFVASLRGSEGLLLDVEALLEKADTSESYVIFPLLGRVKGESHSRHHLLASVNVTASGIQVRTWHGRITYMSRLQGRTRGPAFVDEHQRQSSSQQMNRRFHTCLVDCWSSHPSLFPPNITSEANVWEKYDVFRSMRRGSATRSISRKVSETDRFIVNCWKKREAARGSRPGLPMDHHYCDIGQSLESFLRYTREM